MPRGKYVNHKGRSRHFTTPEELQKESEEEESSSEESSNEDDDQPGGSRGKLRGVEPKAAAPVGKMPTSSEEESDEDSEEERNANKGVASLIEVKNPNRVVKNMINKVSTLNLLPEEAYPKPELSRRERQQIEKQKARQRYEKLHAEGKTRQAKADLARLALIRKQRADAAAKREAEIKHKGSEEKTADSKTSVEEKTTFIKTSVVENTANTKSSVEENSAVSNPTEEKIAEDA